MNNGVSSVKTSAQDYPPTHKTFGCTIRQGHTMNNEWITDRLPNKEDGNNGRVYNSKGCIMFFNCIEKGEAWKHIPKCEPYAKPKRYTVCQGFNDWYVYNEIGKVYVATHLPTREAAERIAAIYEEDIP